MKKFILKSFLYVLILLVALEIVVRIFHLYTEDPPRYIDELGVEKRVPRKEGIAVYGNRNQAYSEFTINNLGFNSYRDFYPTNEKFEIAITGDSFIEGFHQDVQNSIGKKIENQLPSIEVYEYGYAGYDLANQLHLVNAYKEDFEKIDVIVVYLNYESDLKRGTYEPNYARIKKLNSLLFRIRDNIKLLAYGSKIGILEPIKKFVSGKAFQEKENGYKTNVIETDHSEQEAEYLSNFKSLIATFGFDKDKTVLLLDSRKTSASFLNYCSENQIKYIDFATKFKESKKATTLIYDWHWNNHGRSLVAETIAEYIKEEFPSMSQ